MKFTRFIVVAALLILGLLGISAFGSGAPPGNNAVSTPKSVLLSNKQVERSQQVTARDRLDLVLLSNRNWVKERVGAMVLILKPIDPAKIYTLDGYGEVQFKPKINIQQDHGTNGFTGLGGNHYARADV